MYQFCNEGIVYASNSAKINISALGNIFNNRPRLILNVNTITYHTFI